MGMRAHPWGIALNIRKSYRPAMIAFLIALLNGGAVAAPTVSRLQVRIVTGSVDLAAGSRVELRIYEAGKGVLRLPLTHGEGWPRESTRSIPLVLAEPLDPQSVQRFALYYRAASPLSPGWEVAAAEVGLESGGAVAERLLNTTLSGVIERQGLLATEVGDASTSACRTDADCDDHRRCNGAERCAPRTAGADSRGCVRGTPLVCPVNQVCSEAHGCRGPEPVASADRADSR